MMKVVSVLLCALGCAVEVQADVELGDWHCVGPFKDEEFGNVARSLEYRFEPEVDYLGELPPEAPDLTKTYRMKAFPGYLELERKWEARTDWTDGFHNLLPRGPAPSRNESVYLYRTLTADAARTVTAHLRVKDFYKVWLNGRQVGVRNQLTKDRTIYPNPEPLALNLSEGENQLMIKNTVRWAERGFSFAIEGMHEVADRGYLDINRHENRTAEDAQKYVESFKFGPKPIPMYSPVEYRIDEYLSRFPASPGAVAYDAKLAALSERKTATLAFAKALEAALDEEVRKLPPILFIRHPLAAVNAIAPYENEGAVPSSICRLDPSEPGAAPEIVFHEPDMKIYDMCLSYDAKTIFFSGKASEEGAYWQIYSIGLDGSNLKQITDEDCNNISPCELPNGRLAFITTRHGTFVVCQGRRAGMLFTMEKDGSDVRLISASIDSDHTPRVTNDGRILFTRWDYGVEKNVFARHGLWTVDPDGKHMQLFFGNTIEDPGGFWSPMPIPGRPEVVCVFGPHHSFHAGMIGLVWNGRGTENPRGEGYRWITREMPVYGDHKYPDGYQDPYPINEKQFLCSYGGVSARGLGKSQGMEGMAPLNLLYLDVYGNERIIHKDPDGLSCYQPILLQSREKPPVIPDAIPANQWTYQDTETMNRENRGLDKTATLIVQDVYRGISKHVKRGEAKYIAVMEQVQKSRKLTGGEAWGHSPLIGRGTVHARRLVGLAPVEEDGSAHFTVPALRSLSLNVLNAEGKALMRMGSDMHAMPGERVSCIGCHEVREDAGIAGQAPVVDSLPIAAGKRPVSPESPEAGWGTDGLIDYTQVIQPIWDKHCVECHQGPKPDGNVNMTADKTRFFSQSYGHLVDRDIVDHLSVFSLDHDENTPLTVGAAVSRIDEFLDESHCGSALTWEERFRIYCWIDANVPYYGTYDSEMVEGSPRGLGMRDCWETKNNKVTWATRDLQGVFDRRCLECHRRTVLNQSWLIPVEMEVASDIWGDKALTSHGFGKKWKLVNKLGPEFRINLTNPSHSSLLMAPLAKAGGGLGMCEEKDGAPVFAAKSDADYQTMLQAIETGAERLEEYPRVDMLGRERLMNPREASFLLAADPEAAEAESGADGDDAAAAVDADKE